MVCVALRRPAVSRAAAGDAGTSARRRGRRASERNPQGRGVVPPGCVARRLRCPGIAARRAPTPRHDTASQTMTAYWDRLLDRFSIELGATRPASRRISLPNPPPQGGRAMKASSFSPFPLAGEGWGGGSRVTRLQTQPQSALARNGRRAVGAERSASEPRPLPPVRSIVRSLLLRPWRSFAADAAAHPCPAALRAAPNDLSAIAGQMGRCGKIFRDFRRLPSETRFAHRSTAVAP